MTWKPKECYIKANLIKISDLSERTKGPNFNSDKTNFQSRFLIFPTKETH